MELEFAKYSLLNLISIRNKTSTPFNYYEVIKILFDLLENLLDLYVNEISHFDIKPENILYLGISDEFILADYGLSEKIKCSKFSY